MQLPSADECDALIHDRKLTAIVYFLDETFEELTYDVTTTVLEAVEQLAGIIKLQNYTTFTLYESRRVCRRCFSIAICCEHRPTQLCEVTVALAQSSVEGK